MAKNGILKNKLKSLLFSTGEDENKILSVDNRGDIQLKEQGTNQEQKSKIFVSSTTYDYENGTDKIYLPMEAITEDNFYNNELIFIYDTEKEYRQSVYKPLHIFKQKNNDVLCTYFYYKGIENFLYIMERQGLYYYKFNHVYVIDVYYDNSVEFTA